jgi:hypothetical protein
MRPTWNVQGVHDVQGCHFLSSGSNYHVFKQTRDQTVWRVKQPYNEGDHATQLLTDITALREYRTSSMLKSTEGYVKKSREQPSIKESQTNLHAAERANETVRYQNAPKTYARAANTLKTLTSVMSQRTLKTARSPSRSTTATEQPNPVSHKRPNCRTRKQRHQGRHQGEQQ